MSPSIVFYGDSYLVSVTGIQGWDPLGPAPFIMDAEGLIGGLATEFSVWYLDDENIRNTSNKKNKYFCMKVCF